MSLYETFMVPCTIVERTRVPDGEGGWTAAWSDGAGFMAAIVLASSIDARVAEAQGVTGVHTVTTRRDVSLGFHDAFRRNSDGRVFRITKVNDPTPGAATFQFNQYQAEEWALPSDGE